MTHQFGVIRYERFDQVLAVGCECSTEGSESQEQHDPASSHVQTEEDELQRKNLRQKPSNTDSFPPRGFKKNLYMYMLIWGRGGFVHAEFFCPALNGQPNSPLFPPAPWP